LYRAPRKHFSWTSPGPENGQALIFFRQVRKTTTFYKMLTYQGFTSKQTLIWVNPLSFKNCDP